MTSARTDNMEDVTRRHWIFRRDKYSSAKLRKKSVKEYDKVQQRESCEDTGHGWMIWSNDPHGPSDFEIIAIEIRQEDPVVGVVSTSVVSDRMKDGKGSK